MTIEYCQLFVIKEQKKTLLEGEVWNGYIVIEVRKYGTDEIIHSVRYKSDYLPSGREAFMGSIGNPERGRAQDERMQFQIVSELMQEGWEPYATNEAGQVTMMKREV